MAIEPLPVEMTDELLDSLMTEEEEDAVWAEIIRERAGEASVPWDEMMEDDDLD
jgi:hypothetical protein